MYGLIVSFLFIGLMGPLQAVSCAFCREEVLHLQTVYTSEHFYVLLDYEPRIDGHLLVVPKRHVVKAHELSQEEWQELHAVVPKVIRVFTQALNTDQYIVLEKNGPDAHQDVPHVHFHFFPMTPQANWQRMLGVTPERLSPEELERKVSLFREYFSS